jgi:hypothetical protein
MAALNELPELHRREDASLSPSMVKESSSVGESYPPFIRLRSSGLWRDSLPKSKLIPALPKIADMVSISSKGLCGGNDFRCTHLKEGRLSSAKAWGHQVEKSRYALDNKILSKPFK